MDPEKQPLLYITRPDNMRQRRFRPLTTQEVIEYRNEATWYRARCCLVVMFWSLMAMSLSIITSLLVTAQCNSLDTSLGRVPTVPPVHMSLAPLIFSGRQAYNADQ